MTQLLGRRLVLPRHVARIDRQMFHVAPRNTVAVLLQEHGDYRDLVQRPPPRQGTVCEGGLQENVYLAGNLAGPCVQSKEGFNQSRIGTGGLRAKPPGHVRSELEGDSQLGGQQPQWLLPASSQAAAEPHQLLFSPRNSFCSLLANVFKGAGEERIKRLLNGGFRCPFSRTGEDFQVIRVDGNAVVAFELRKVPAERVLPLKTILLEQTLANLGLKPLHLHRDPRGPLLLKLGRHQSRQAKDDQGVAIEETLDGSLHRVELGIAHPVATSHLHFTHFPTIRAAVASSSDPASATRNLPTRIGLRRCSVAC